MNTGRVNDRQWVKCKARQGKTNERKCPRKRILVQFKPEVLYERPPA
jgi:hypothetical protein